MNTLRTPNVHPAGGTVSPPPASVVVRQLDSTNQTQVREFIGLEPALLGCNPLFVPQIAADLERRLSGRSAFWQGMEQALFVASHDGRDVARCAALISRRYQTFRGEAVGFIGFFAAADHVNDAVLAMLVVAERWLAARGVTRVIAPYNGSALLGMGIWTDAFDEPPMFPYNWNPPSYAAYLEQADYRPSKPLWVFEVNFASPQYQAVAQRAVAQAHCRVRPVSRLHWQRDIRHLLRVFNEGFMDDWEFMPCTLAEFHEVFDVLRLLDPHLLLFAEVDREVVGFCLGFADWNPLQRSLKGRLGPFEILRVMVEGRRYTRGGLMMIAVLPEHRGKHVGQTLAARLFRSWEGRGLPSALYYVVNDGNLASRRLAESFGGRGRILQHVFDKPLAP